MKKVIKYSIFPAVVLCIIIVVFLWQSRSVSPEEIAMSDAKVEREDCWAIRFSWEADRTVIQMCPPSHIPFPANG